MGRIRLTLLLVCVSGALQAQVNRYMVFFHDKAGTPHTISSPESFLSARALQRRSNQDISVTELDLPVSPAYVDEVRNAGATVLYRTKWMNGILVEATASLIPTLQGLPAVASVEYVAPGARPVPGGRIRSSRKFKDTAEGAAATDVQLAMEGMDEMHNAGFRGEGMLIAILDAGYPGADTISYFKHVFDEGRFDAATSYDFVSGGSNVFRHHNHGINVWSTVGAFKQNVFVGGAYKANFLLFVTEHAPTEYRVEEYNWVFAAERADSAGVDVINTSLGYRDFDDSSMDYSASDMDGETAVITRAAEIAAARGIAVVVSAGNEGNSVPTTIGAPADAENVLTVGAVSSSGFITVFSSIGPTGDGRLKPDVAGLGSLVSVVRPDGSLGSSNGTSFSSPLTASLVAGVWQMAPALTVKELFEVIRMSGSQANAPDNFLGHGIPNFTDVDVEETIQESIFPNPAGDEIFIDVGLNTEYPMVTLTDSKGAACSAPLTKISNRKYRLDISGQPASVYFLRFQQGKYYTIYKIVKIR